MYLLPKVHTLSLEEIIHAETHSLAQCCFTATETVRIIRDGEPGTATTTFTQLLSSAPYHFTDTNHTIFALIVAMVFNCLNRKLYRSCVKVEVTVLGSLSLIVLIVSVDVKQH